MTDTVTNATPTTNTMTDAAAPTNVAAPETASSLTATTEPADVPVARVHGAGRFSEEFYWSAHTVGFVLFLVAVTLLVGARGPRRRDALAAAEGHDAPST